MDPTRVIDPAALERLKEWGGETLLGRVIDLYLENSPDRMEQIRNGLSSGTLDEVERGAHSLRSSAGNVGAVEVSRLALGMEERAVEGKGEGLEALHRELEEAYIASREELARLRDGDTP